MNTVPQAAALDRLYRKVTWRILPLLMLGVGTTYAGARMTLAVLSGILVLAFALLELDRLRSRGAIRVPMPASPATAAPESAGGN